MLLIAAVTAAIAAARHPTATKAGEAGRFRVAAVAATKAAAWGGISTQNFARYTDSRKCPHLMRESEGIFGFFFVLPGHWSSLPDLLSKRLEKPFLHWSCAATSTCDSDDFVRRLRRPRPATTLHSAKLQPATAPRRHPLAWGEEDNEEDFFGLTLLLGLGLLGVCGSALWFLFYMNWIHFFVKHEVVINLLSTTCHVTATYARF